MGKLYVVCGVFRKIGVEVMGRAQDIPLTWAKGMVGAMPVFDNYEDAINEAGDTQEVVTLNTMTEISKQEGVEG